MNRWSSMLVFAVGAVALADGLPPDATYRPLPTVPLSTVMRNDRAAKPAVQQRQRALLESRYDLSDRPIPNVKMSGGGPFCCNAAIT